AARKTLTTMSAELSAEFSTFEADGVMNEWLRERTAQAFEGVAPDKDARYAAVRKVDLSKLEPLVAFPDTVVENSRPVADAAGIRIDQAFIGSCANGTMDDLRMAARILAGRGGAADRRLLITPGAPTVYPQAAPGGGPPGPADAGGRRTTS